MNPLFNLLNSNNNNDLMSRFEKFRRTFTGDPKMMVQQLLSSGQMTQEQFNQLQMKATQLMNALRR